MARKERNKTLIASSWNRNGFLRGGDGRVSMLKTGLSLIGALVEEGEANQKYLVEKADRRRY